MSHAFVHQCERAATHTCTKVSLRQGLQDGVHGSHVEDQAQLRHTHGDEAQQEDGTEDTLHEGLICAGNERREVVSVRSARFPSHHRQRRHS